LGRSTTAWLWDATTGVLKARFIGRGEDYLVGNEIQGGIGGPSEVSFSPDGSSLLVVAREAREVRLWKIQTGKQSMILANMQTMFEAAFSPDGRLLALAAGLHGLQVLDLRTQKLVTTRWETKDVIGAWRVGFSREGSTLIAGIEARNDKSGYYFFDVHTGRSKAMMRVTRENELTGKMSRDGLTFVTYDKNSRVSLWDITHGQLKKSLIGIEGQIRSLSISPDSRTLAIISNDKAVRIYDSESGERRLELVGLEGKPSFSIFSPDGTILITEDKNGIKVWDPVTGVLKQTLNQARSPLAFSPDGKLLVTAGKGDTALIWQVRGK
jgi:WD40 repeat protein